MDSLLEELPVEKLTRPQQDALAKKIQANRNDHKSISTLVMGTMREAINYARKITSGNIPDTELISLCYETLVSTARRFKPGWQRFFAYSKPALRGDLSTRFVKLKVVKKSETVPIELERKEAHRKNGIRHDESLLYHNNEIDDSFPAERYEPPWEAVFTKDRWSAVRPLIVQNCNEREQMIITLLYQCGFTFAEVGSLLRVSRTAIQGIHSKAIKKLRAAIAEKGLLEKS